MSLRLRIQAYAKHTHRTEREARYYLLVVALDLIDARRKGALAVNALRASAKLKAKGAA